MFSDEGQRLSPGSQERHQAVTPATPIQQSQTETQILPELSALDIESQLIEYETSGGGGSSGSVGLSSDVTSSPPLFHPPQPKSESVVLSQVSVQSTFSTIQNESQSTVPSYSSRTPQYPTPRPAMSQRAQFYVQQQSGYFGGRAETQHQQPPPPPPYPGSSRHLTQPPPAALWRPQTQLQRLPSQYQSQMAYLTPAQQQQQHRFTEIYRGASSNLVPATASGNGTLSSKSRQSPYLYGTAQMASTATEGGMLSNQQLKTMLRQGRI